MRQTRAVTPNDNLLPSAMHPLRYGNCSSCDHDADPGTVASSARSFAMHSGLLRRWKCAIAIDFAVDSVPNMVILVVCY